MKNIGKLLLSAVVLLFMAACNKAEFKTFNYVSFDARRAKIKETAGIYKLPVSVHHSDKCIVTYKVTDGTAKVGTDFDIVDEAGNPDPSGTMQISGGLGYIYIKVVDRSGVQTGNKSFQIDLLKASTNNVNLGNTTTVKCTIVDIDAAINKLMGSWSGTGKDSYGDPNSMSWYLDVLEEGSPEAVEAQKKYPSATIVINNLKFSDLGMDSADNNLYAYFDDSTNKLHIYANQPFNAYTFTFQDGSEEECYVALTGQNGAASDDVIFTFNKETEELTGDKKINIGVFSHDETMEYYGAFSGFNAGLTMTKAPDVEE